MSSPPSPSSPDPQVLQDLSPISGNSQLSGVATSTVPGASSTPMASTGGLPPGLGALATPLPGASGFSNRPGALARPPGVLVDPATPGVPHSSPGGVATPTVGAQGHNIIPGAAATPNTSTLGPAEITKWIGPDNFMDHFDTLITVELQELGLKDKALLRAIDKLIKLNNAVLDSYFDTKFKELKANMEYQISETTAHFIKVLNEKDKALNELTSRVQCLEEKNAILEAKLSSTTDQVSELDKRLDAQDMYERRDTLVLSGADLPPEKLNEDPVSIIVNAATNVLNVNLQTHDISVAHRLGPKRSDKERPIICKFVRRSTKSLVLHKCITSTSKIYANEHLTPPRRRILSKLLKVKKNTKLITQLHTKNGIFYMKLKDVSERFTFTTEEALITILTAENPYLLDAYRKALSPSGIQQSV